MLNGIPIFGWFISLAVNVSLAVPFWICWTGCGIGQTYFYWLPPVYHAPGFWACVGIFTVLGIMKCFVPTLATTSSKVEKKDD